MSDYLDSNGLRFLWNKIKGIFVEKEKGKGLSTNDFTNTYKSKLDGIATGANKYTLPKASGSTLGGVKVGEGLEIDSNGVLSAASSGGSEESLCYVGLIDFNSFNFDGNNFCSNDFDLPFTASSVLFFPVLEIGSNTSDSAFDPTRASFAIIKKWESIYSFTLYRKNGEEYFSFEVQINSDSSLVGGITTLKIVSDDMYDDVIYQFIAFK